jgi:V-type H+-transporting ATPase subunit a
MFRSEEMALYSLDISKDDAWEVMNQLGKNSTLHFLDLNQREQSYNRAYASYIKRCDEAERRARYIEEQARKFRMPVQKAKSLEELLGIVDKMLKERNKVLSSS